MSPAPAERGAILVQVALALIVVLAFGAFVIDYGVLWASRGQAQNAADAAALAGAVARAYGDFGDKSDTGPAKLGALSVALAHKVWGETPSVTVADISFPLCPDGTDACVRVNVYRDTAHGNALPTFFARLVGVDTQSVRATATAQAGIGNAVNCMKPWALADKWGERRPVDPDVWTVDSTFDKYDSHGAVLPGVVDFYNPPVGDDFGTGFHPFEDGHLSGDYGLLLTLKIGDNTNPQQLSSGWFQPLALSCTGGNCYRDAIAGCAPGGFALGQTLQTEPGNMIGPTKQGVDDLVALDPGARWDTVRNGVADSAFAVSPRIVPVPLINIDEYMSRDPSGRDTVLVTNIMGFFLLGMNGNDVEGRLCALPGTLIAGVPTVGNSSSFLRTIKLVR